MLLDTILEKHQSRLRMSESADHYQRIYRRSLEIEARWLRFGARPKANSIQALVSDLDYRLESLCEMGCGTGSVLRECMRRRLAKRYFAIDGSQEALEYVRRRNGGQVVSGAPRPGNRYSRSGCHLRPRGCFARDRAPPKSRAASAQPKWKMPILGGRGASREPTGSVGYLMAEVESAGKKARGKSLGPCPVLLSGIIQRPDGEHRLENPPRTPVLALQQTGNCL